jgi:hypothetical protein
MITPTSSTHKCLSWHFRDACDEFGRAAFNARSDERQLSCHTVHLLAAVGVRVLFDCSSRVCLARIQVGGGPRRSWSSMSSCDPWRPGRRPVVVALATGALESRRTPLRSSWRRKTCSAHRGVGVSSRPCRAQNPVEREVSRGLGRGSRSYGDRFCTELFSALSHTLSSIRFNSLLNACRYTVRYAAEYIMYITFSANSSAISLLSLGPSQSSV